MIINLGKSDFNPLQFHLKHPQFWDNETQSLIHSV